MRLWPLLLALLGLAACGGGGGPAAIAPPTTNLVDLGTVASTVPTTVEAAFPNPLGGNATVTEATTTGPFDVPEGTLPIEVARGGSAVLDLTIDPTGAGVARGTLTLRWEGVGGPASRTYDLRANGELVSWSLLTPTLDFGQVAVGGFADLEAQLLNLSTLSVVTLTGVLLPSSDFTVVGAPFPQEVGPGEIARFIVRYAPGAEGEDDGEILVGPSDVGAAVAIPVLASTTVTGTEVVTDFGLQALDGSGRTNVLSVNVPADAISLTLEGWIPSQGFTSAFIGLETLTGPGNKVYENAASTGAYVWYPGSEIFSTTVPNTDRTDVQLVPGGGTYRFQLQRLFGTGSAMRVRAIVERRSPALADVGTLDLNVWLANGITPTAATAEDDSRLQSVLVRIDQILSQQGIRLGDVDYYDVTSAAFDEVTSNAEFANLLRTTADATETRLNLFFVEVAFGGGVVGVSATIAGPKRNGTEASGVMSIYDGFTTNTIGLIAAHEIGHFLGLYHTVEQDGSHDFIDDTDECPASGTDDVCTVTGGGYVMHWQAVGGTTITDGQGLVLRGHPLVSPGDVQAVTLSRRGVTLSPADVAELLTLPRHWCGTCAPSAADAKPQ